MIHKNQEIAIVHGKIPNGTYDVARYLGIDPEKSIFYHSTSFDSEDTEQRARWAINKGNFLYAEAIVLTPDFTEGRRRVQHAITISSCSTIMTR